MNRDDLARHARPEIPGVAEAGIPVPFFVPVIPSIKNLGIAN